MYIVWSNWIDAFYVVYDIIYSRSNPSNHKDMVRFCFWACDESNVSELVSVLVWGMSQS